MFLRRVRIENFRAIESLVFELEETTVLIGENGSGKTSLLHALKRCLGVHSEETLFHFEPHDFRPPPVEGQQSAPAAIRIRLVFEERVAGEWPGTHLQAFGRAAVKLSDQRHHVDWEINGFWDPATGKPGCSCRFFRQDGQVIEGLDDSAIARELRRLTPFLIFDEVDRPPEPGPAAEAFVDESDPGLRDLERVTREIYGKLTGGFESLTPEDLRLGRSVARRVWKRYLSAKGSQRPFRPPSGGAQSLGPLLVFGALLKARGAKQLDPEGQPIFAVEHIESRLHPSTLGSMWRVLEQMPLQKLVSTYSGEMLSAIPLQSIRRLVRRQDRVDVFRLHHERMSKDDQRRLRYHIRARRGSALFNRCWLLVEGETEFWLLPEMARLLGYDFHAEGIACVEFAQSGIRPILQLANDLGIRWHLVVDGDAAGQIYTTAGAEFLNGADPDRHITRMPERDVERYLWSAGYAKIYRTAAGRAGGRAEYIIERAVRARSKPFLALSVVEAAAEPGMQVPPVLRHAIEAAIGLARGS